MDKKNYSSKSHKIEQYPNITSTKYIKDEKNKAIKNSPYGKKEPSTHTSYK